MARLALLRVPTPWAARILQVTLAVGTLEWLRTAWVFGAARAAADQPYARLLVIIGTVAALTALAAWMIGHRTGRRVVASEARFASFDDRGVRNPGRIR